ncbi:MAG TPA: glycerophosphodiester phosphodiesterase family protein, partial [Pyrinomonadaceae bacterium]
MNSPLIIGHRGASAIAPENTMAAFREALAVGADGIEFDVRLTRDGVPVVIHDSSLRRTGGLPQRVADLTWAEISKIDVGSWFADTFANETVPSLAELFTLFQSNNSTLYLEMKCDSPGEQRPLAEACVKAIEQHSLKSRVVVECFQLPALKIMKEIDPEIKTVALFEPRLTNPSVLLDQRIINQAADIGAAALALHHRLA